MATNHQILQATRSELVFSQLDKEFLGMAEA